jgi:hypothetical protein
MIIRIIQRGCSNIPFQHSGYECWVPHEVGVMSGRLWIAPSRQIGIGELAPHDLRRTAAKLTGKKFTGILLVGCE